MTQFTVAIKGEGEATARNTADLDDALDWFTNACTEVMDEDSDLTYATISAGGVIWGAIKRHGLGPDEGEAEVIPLRRAAGR